MVEVEGNEDLRARSLKYGETFRLLSRVTGDDAKPFRFPSLCVMTRTTSTTSGRGGDVDVQGSAIVLKQGFSNIPIYANDIVERVDVTITVKR